MHIICVPIVFVPDLDPDIYPKTRLRETGQGPFSILGSSRGGMKPAQVRRGELALTCYARAAFVERRLARTRDAPAGSGRSLDINRKTAREIRRMSAHAHKHGFVLFSFRFVVTKKSSTLDRVATSPGNSEIGSETSATPYSGMNVPTVHPVHALAEEDDGTHPT